MMTRVRVTGVFVADQQRALEFYRDKLGFDVLTDEPYSEDARWIEVAPRGAQTRLSLARPRAGRAEDRIGGFAHIVFKCEDVRATAEELRGRGVEMVGEVQEESWGVMAQFQDPDGNVFVLS